MSKRCAYYQGPGHNTDRCYNLRHAIQDLIDTKVIALCTRPSITNNPLPNHNFGKGPRINCLMSKGEGEKDLSKLIYDLPECFIMTWEELMGITSVAMIYRVGILQNPKLPNIHIWGETLQTIIKLSNIHIWGGDTSNPNQMTQHPYTGMLGFMP